MHLERFDPVVSALDVSSSHVLVRSRDLCDWPKVWTDLPQNIEGVRLSTIGHTCVSFNRLCHGVTILK